MRLKHCALALLATLALAAGSAAAQTAFHVVYKPLPKGGPATAYGELLGATWHGTPVSVYVVADVALFKLGESFYGPLPLSALDALDNAQDVKVTSAVCVFVNHDHYTSAWLLGTGTMSQAFATMQAFISDGAIYPTELCNG